MKLFGNPRRLRADVHEKCHGKPRHATKQKNLKKLLGALVWLSYMNYILHIVIMSYEYEYA